MIKKAILSILAIFSFAIIYAQDNVWIKGVVTDNKMQPIYGASVYVKGTLFGIRTISKGSMNFPFQNIIYLQWLYLKRPILSNKSIVSMAIWHP